MAAPITDPSGPFMIAPATDSTTYSPDAISIARRLRLAAPSACSPVEAPALAHQPITAIVNGSTSG